MRQGPSAVHDRPRRTDPRAARRPRHTAERQAKDTRRSRQWPCDLGAVDSADERHRSSAAAGQDDPAASTSRSPAGGLGMQRHVRACRNSCGAVACSGSPSRIMRWAVSVSKGGWTPQASTSRVRPPARRMPGLRTCDPHPRDAAMIRERFVRVREVGRHRTCRCHERRA